MMIGCELAGAVALQPVRLSRAHVALSDVAGTLTLEFGKRPLARMCAPVLQGETSSAPSYGSVPLQMLQVIRCKGI